MKRVKLALPVLAFAIAILASAFSFKKEPAKKFTSLYWYKITYNTDHPDGAVLSSSDFYVQDVKSNVSSPCASGSASDCLRGFSSQLSTFPEESAGADHIMKP